MIKRYERRLHDVRASTARSRAASRLRLPGLGSDGASAQALSGSPWQLEPEIEEVPRADYDIDITFVGTDERKSANFSTTCFACPSDGQDLYLPEVCTQTDWTSADHEQLDTV